MRVTHGLTLWALGSMILLSGCMPFYGQSWRGLRSPFTRGEIIGTSNGERIYFTATNSSGRAIRYRGGPNFGGMGMGMMGSYLTCTACHGPDGGGGVHQMHMYVMEAPEIRFAALSEEAEEHGGEHGEYTLAYFRLAVIGGKHPDGESLERDMPRWRMSEEDLADLFEFIKSLP